MSVEIIVKNYPSRFNNMDCPQSGCSGTLTQDALVQRLETWGIHYICSECGLTIVVPMMVYASLVVLLG